ncbi:MAG: hypothetical protein AAF349_18650 [Cyanobacteria bacterium P01_A01_bin.68]
MEQKAGQEQSRLVDGYVIVIRQVIPIKMILNKILNQIIEILVPTRATTIVPLRKTL